MKVIIETEEIENLDPDNGKSEDDIIDEITGQMKLFKSDMKWHIKPW